MTLSMLGMLNTPEIIALLALALIFFGAKKLPEMARGLGQGIKEFKKASRDVTNELHQAMEAEPPPTPPPPPRPSPVEPSAELSTAPPAAAVAAPPEPGENAGDPESAPPKAG